MQAVETVFLACKKGRRKMRIVWSQLFSKPNLMTLPSMSIFPTKLYSIRLPNPAECLNAIPIITFYSVHKIQPHASSYSA